MGRYGIVRGTNKDGVYTVLGCSDDILNFLTDQGAASTSYTLDKINDISSGFEALSDYQQYASNDYPVAVRYLPMHLNKLEDMPSGMKPIYTVSVSGNENEARNSQYSAAVMMDWQELLKSNRYSYLDQIFGTPLIGWQQLANIREKKGNFDCAMPPVRVDPRLTPGDMNAVLATVQAIYEEKRVILQLERGCSFNKRSMELLEEIYSLMQPGLATEIGFATYQKPIAIEKLINTAGTRIFVIPNAIKLENAPENTVVLRMDDADRIPLDEKNPVVGCLRKWSRLSWENRLEAMTKLFNDPQIRFMDSEKFVEISRGLFENEFMEWSRMRSRAPEAGQLASLQALKEKYDSFELLKVGISWVHERFVRMVRYLKPDKSNLNSWVLSACADCELPGNAGQKAERLELARFGISLLDEKTVDSLFFRVPEEVRKRAELRKGQEKDAEFAAERLACQKLLADKTSELARQKADYDQKLKDQQGLHDQELQSRQAQYNQQLQDRESDFRRQYDTLKSKAEAMLIGQKTEFDQAIQSKNEELARQQAEQETALREEQSRHAQALMDQKGEFTAQFENLKKVAGEEIEKQKQEHALAIQQIRTDLQDAQTALKTKDTRLMEQDRELQQVRGDLQAVRNDLQTATANVADAQEKEQKMIERGKALRAACEQQKAELAQNRSELSQKQEQMAEKDQKIQQLHQKLAEVSGTNYLTRNRILFAGLGFLTALILCGIIWGVCALIFNNDPEVITPETTAPATTAVTEAVPTTEAAAAPTTAPAEQTEVSHSEKPVSGESADPLNEADSGTRKTENETVPPAATEKPLG